MKMLNTNLETVLKRLNQYNSRIERNIDKYEHNKQLIKLIGPQMDGSTLFKGLFSEDEEAVKERLDLIQKTNKQKIENLNGINNKLFNQIKYSMYASHRFLYYIVLKNFKVTPANGGSYRNDIFSYTQNNIRYAFDTKGGRSFGTHLSTGTLTGPKENLQFNKNNSYFIKSCRGGYLISNDKVTGTHVSSTQVSSLVGSEGKPGLAPDINNMKIDFKELFVYKCLQYLNFGAEISFFINPYLRKALYIQSKDLNSEEKIVKYQTAQNLEEGQIRNQEAQFEIQLTEMDIIARSFLLTDMHNENIMFKKTKQGFDLKIVDFIVPDSNKINEINGSYVIEVLQQLNSLKERQDFIEISVPGNGNDDLNYSLIDMSTSFVTANTLTKYSQNEDGNKIISETLKRNINNANDINHKRLAGEEALKLLEKRLNTVGNRPGISDGLARIMQQAEQDIESFMQQENQIIPQSNSSLLGLTNEQITAEKDDLHKYKKGVLRNLENIMKFIESGKEIEDDQQVL